jgi:DNA-binding NarL/FixJ family response regulator
MERMSVATSVVVIVSCQRLFAETLAYHLLQHTAFDVHTVDAQQALVREALDDLGPAVVILALDDVVTRPENIRRLVENLPSAQVIALDPPDPRFRRVPGRIVWLPVDASLEDVRHAVHEAAAGRQLLQRQPVHPPRSREDSALASLSQRETDILRRLAGGQSTAVISADLGIAPGTVRKHVQHILDKLDVHSKFEAAAMANRLGIS